MRGYNAPIMTIPIRFEKKCLVSTPAHLRSFIGRFVYICTDKGTLTLWPDRVSFTGQKSSYEITLDTIVQLDIGHYSRLAKPLRLDYISISYVLHSKESTILLTPTDAKITTVWNMNRCVASWMESLRQAVSHFTPASPAAKASGRGG